MNQSISKMKFTIFLFFLCSSLSMGVSAESPEHYRIEVLIFENSDPQGVDNEQLASPNNDSQNITGLSVDSGAEGQFRTSSENALELAGARDKLASSGHYRGLYHKGWSQEVTSKDRSAPALIEVPGIKGSIHIYKQRHLHLSTDMIYSSLEGSVRLNERRRMNSKELHFLDHPYFGILVRAAKL